MADRIWVAHFFSHFGASREETRRFEHALFAAGFGNGGELGYDEELEGDGYWHHWTYTAIPASGVAKASASLTAATAASSGSPPSAASSSGMS